MRKKKEREGEEQKSFSANQWHLQTFLCPSLDLDVFQLKLTYFKFKSFVTLFQVDFLAGRGVRPAAKPEESQAPLQPLDLRLQAEELPRLAGGQETLRKAHCMHGAVEVRLVLSLIFLKKVF